MRLTKAEISQVKLYWEIIQVYFEHREETKANLIKYGWFTGCIHQIIKGHIYHNDKDLEKNNNADEYLTEQFGDKFMVWLCGGHRLYAYGDERRSEELVEDVVAYETSEEAKDRKMREMIASLKIKE